MKYPLDGSSFTTMADAQKRLVDRLRQVSSAMPAYPIDPNIKDHQKFMKDLALDFIAELGEAYEKSLFILEYLTVNGNDESYLELAIQEYHEEVADAAHFLLELLLYSNVTEASLNAYYERELTQRNLADAIHFKGKMVQTSLAYAMYLNEEDNMAFHSFQDCYSVELTGVVKPILKLSVEKMLAAGTILWGTTFQITKATQALRNKYWKRNEEKADTDQFQQALAQTWVMFSRYLEMMGITDQMLFKAYAAKNAINHQRIDQKY